MHIYTIHLKKSGRALVIFTQNKIEKDQSENPRNYLGETQDANRFIEKIEGLLEYKSKRVESSLLTLEVQSIQDAKPIRYDQLVNTLSNLVKKLKNDLLVEDEGTKVSPSRVTSCHEDEKTEQPKRGWFW